MRVRNSRLTLIVAALGAIVTVAACESEPPTFDVPTELGFVVGGQISESDATPEGAFTFRIPRLLRWSASDNDIGCGVRYDVEVVYSGSEPELIVEDDPRTELAVNHDDYNGDFGGGSLSIHGWNVIAHDCSGNSRVSGNFLGSNVWQENGRNAFGYDPRPASITWSGTWAAQTGSWASGGSQRFTSSRNASVSFRKDFVDGQHIGIVMARGPARGSADVLVDDVKVATIDTNGAVNDNRRIVYERRMSSGFHTVKVVNMASTGHPRIDIDAFLT